MNRVGPGRAGDATEAGIGFAAERRSDTTITPNTAIRAGRGEPPQRPRTIALVAWRPLAKGALRGFATVLLPIGLKLIDCPVLVSNGKAWVNLPAKPVLDQNGQHKRDVNDKAQYAPVLEWRSRELSDQFTEVVIAAPHRLYPDVLDGSGS